MTTVAVLGASRSGTMIAAQAIAAAAGMRASFEARLAADTDGVICAPDSHYACPNLNEAAAFLDDLPEAKAVVLWRDPADFIASRRRAGGKADFVAHCRLWVNAMAAIGRLHARHSTRIAVIPYETLLNSRAALGRAVAHVVGGAADFAEKFEQFLASSQPGRTALRLGRPVTAVKDTGWSHAERAAFAGICGETIRSMGLSEILAGAEQPMRLETDWFHTKAGSATGGLAIAPSGRRSAAPSLILTDHQAGEYPRLLIQAIAIGGRRMFSLGLRNKAAEAAGFFLEIAGSLSCRLLHAQKIIVEPSSSLVVDVILPVSDGLIDVILTVMAPIYPNMFEIAVDEMMFRRLPAGTCIA